MKEVRESVHFRVKLIFAGTKSGSFADWQCFFPFFWGERENSYLRPTVSE